MIERRIIEDEKWALARGLEGVVTTGVVVISGGTTAERKRAEGFRDEIERLRTDGSMFRDVMAIEGNRVPKTVIVADLRDPADAEVKKAIRRLTKVWAKRSPAPHAR